MGRKKISGEERKAGITEAARGEFAKQGFHGTSMRDIAKAAKVSEALIYRHFPSKEALYKSIYFYLNSRIESLGNYFKGKDPSTEMLVSIVYALVNMILREMPGQEEEQKLFERLLVYSLLENTSFAKIVFEEYDKELFPIWESCVLVAQERGDMYTSYVDPATKMWLSHHLIMAINFLHMSGESLFPYSKSMQDLMNGLVVFILRGVGIKDEIIQEHLKPDLLEDIVDEIFNPECA